MKRLAAVLPCLLAAASALAAAPPSWCVAVWYPSSDHPGGYDTIIASADVIDIVFPFWFTPDAEGAILSQAGTNWEDQVAAWRAAGLLVLPSVFATHSTFMAEPLLSAHVAALVALVEAGDFDGIDLDYEMFPLATRATFSGFVEALGAAMHERGKLISVTVHAKTEANPSGFPSAAAQDWPRLAAAADLFNVMTYDFTNRNEAPGPVAPRSWVARVVEYGLSAVGERQLLVGMPLYGYTWKRGRPPAAATTWEATERLIAQFGLTPQREPDSLELRVDLDVTGLPKQTVYVSDGATTAGRLAALAAAGALGGGVAIWGLGGEDPAAWDAIRTVRPAACALRPHGAEAAR